MSHIIDNLYIGDYQNAKDFQNSDIYIITCASEINDIKNYHKIWLFDGKNNKNFINDITEVIKIINNLIIENKKILIHCSAGMSRSPTIVLYYLMKYKKMKFDDAYMLLKQKRPCINIHRWFLSQIKNFSESLPKDLFYELRKIYPHNEEVSCYPYNIIIDLMSYQDINLDTLQDHIFSIKDGCYLTGIKYDFPTLLVFSIENDNALLVTKHNFDLSDIDIKYHNYINSRMKNNIITIEKLDDRLRVNP